ncbi:MAG: type III-A CRISPR-associated RAMP protein Csm5 [Desulfobulbaceae bacterium]|nr:type III-A CRISPR-associated RAMP protein Csm5 [Desulfobulbaceae bacterium]
MNMPTQTTIFFLLRTVSPVHVGSDDVYEPTGFVVDAQNKQLISFDAADFIGMLDNEALDEFSAICRKGTPQSLIEIYRFMDRHKDLAAGKPVAVSDAFVSHFQETLALQGENNILQNLNKYKIKRTAYNPHEDSPYIPGSSLKGSIRTAVLNYRNKKQSVPPYQKKDAGKMEENLVGGKFETDPFRLVKISDFAPIGEIERRIVYGVNRKKKPSKFEARGPEQIFEVVAEGSVFLGSITVSEVPPIAGITKPVTAKELFAALTQFYGSEKKREDVELKAVGIPTVSLELTENQSLLRLGFHSGAECVTVEGHRQIKIMKGKGERPGTEKFATTFWLAANSKNAVNQTVTPLGWAVLEVLTSSDAAKLREDFEQKKRKEEELKQRIFIEQQRERELREEELRTLQEEEARLKAEQEAAEEKERQALAAMSEAERHAHAIQKKETTENEIVELYNKLESFNPEDQKIIAAALKSCWMAGGKWSKKQCSKKQWKKVQKVKNILGEE